MALLVEIKTESALLYLLSLVIVKVISFPSSIPSKTPKETFPVVVLLDVTEVTVLNTFVP